jgi:PBSX family phage portal protein
MSKKKHLSVVEESSLVVDGHDDEGRPRRARLTARIIGPESVRKQLASPDEDGPTDAPQSRAKDEDELNKLFKGKGIMRPSYNLRQLAQMHEQSTELGQAIRSMVTNVVGFGWQLREKQIPETVRERFKEEIERERFMIDTRLKALHATQSLTMIREAEHWDKHSVGQGYLELVENRRGDLVQMNHVHGHSVLMSIRQPKASRTLLPVVRPDLDFRIEEIEHSHRFRKFVQLRRTGSKAKPVWFKEAGDPRVMDWRTGEYLPEGARLPLRWRATALMQNRIYSPVSAYGVPLWIGNLFSLLGSRAAEEINYNTLSSNAIPSMMVIVENGTLTEGSIARMREWTEQHIQKSQNYSTFLLIEGETLDDGSPDPGQFKIRIEPLKRLQQQDELFQDYDQNNRDKVRQAFRLPPIFVGRADDYTRATADTSRDIADEQIFAPERTKADWLINRFVLTKMGARFHTFRSNHPNITDDIELIRMMGIGERSGAVTPRRADRIMRDVFGDDLGPMPQGVDLDIPYSLQFAQAQAGGEAGGGAGGQAPQAKAIRVEDLISLRKSVEQELESRWLLDEQAIYGEAA